MTNDSTNPYSISKRRIRAAFNAAAHRYDAAAVLQREVEQRMLERLDLVKLQPSAVIDIGAGTGHASVALKKRYGAAQLIAVDLAEAMLQVARQRAPRWERWRGSMQWVCGDAESLPIAGSCCDLVFSNLTLQWAGQLDNALTEAQRVLRPGGLLMFSSFGPDTLKELRHCWSQSDGYVHVNAFLDMHDVGDALLRAGFAEPVLDVETFTLTYPDVLALMRDLKTIGANNATAGRNRGLTSRARLEKVVSAYEQLRQDGVLPATYEVVYGHAWRPEKPARAKYPQGEVRIDISRIQRGGNQHE